MAEKPHCGTKPQRSTRQEPKAPAARQHAFNFFRMAVLQEFNKQVGHKQEGQHFHTVLQRMMQKFPISFPKAVFLISRYRAGAGQAVPCARP